MSDIKLFLRNLWRNKLYSVVTVLGFAVALALVILLAAYVRQELSVDQFHKNKNRIYRAVNDTGDGFGPLIGERLKAEYPEIETYTRVFYRMNNLESGDKKMSFSALYVDSSFFRMFSFPLLEGNSSEAFNSKNNVIMTRSYAMELFGSLDVIGKEIKISECRLQVSGIVEDLPSNTHFKPCDLFLRIDLLADLWGDRTLMTTNKNCSFGLYLQTYPGADLSAKTFSIAEAFKKDYWPYQWGKYNTFDLEPLTSVYWSDLEGNSVHTNSKVFVIVLLAIGLVVLILALINYNNLSMARVGFRAKETAVKKLMGFSNVGVMWQFIVESVMLCYIAFAIAILLAFLVRPFFSQVIGAELDFKNQISWGHGLIVFIAVGLLGILAGILPAWMMMHFNPVEVVKGSFRKKVKGVYGNVLICFQYVVTIGLIISAWAIFRQTEFLRDYKLGFNKENVIWLSYAAESSQMETLRNELNKIPGVKGVSFTIGSPLDAGNNSSWKYNDKAMSFQVFCADTAFFRVLDIHVQPVAEAGTGKGVWLNRTAVKELELAEGQTEFQYGKKKLSLLGITDDFYIDELTQKMKPLMIFPYRTERQLPWRILIKMDGKTSALTYDEVRKVYGEFVDGVPFNMGFMDETIDAWYTEYERMAKLVGYFSFISIVFSMMGILAMATYFIQQRVREIGLRRVNGATEKEVVALLVLYFMKWVLLAFVIACPITWYVMDRWLQGFPIRIDLEWWMFIAVGMGVALMALLMVVWQSVKAARTNPVEALKRE